MSAIASESGEMRGIAATHPEAGRSLKRPVKILILAPAAYDTSPGQRYRIEQWARHLGREGFHFTFVPFESEALHRVLYQPGQYVRKAGLMLEAFRRRWRAATTARQFDIVLIHREAALIGPAIIERLVARQGVPIVFDFDDAIWVPYVSPANKWWSYLKCFGKAATICRLSAHVIVGNSYLASYARQHNAHVTIIPSTIDTDVYVPRQFEAHADDRPVIIGWTGSYSTVRHLHSLRDTLRELRMRHDFRLHTIGAPNYRMDGVETISQEWRAESEAQDLLGFDIGIMPVPDDAWSRGKCGMKLLQYMGAAVPAVGSPVGMNTEIIQDGVSGFLASRKEEWIEKLSRLIRDVRLRREIGMAGRDTVETRYSVRTWIPQVRAVLASAARSTGVW